MQQTGEKPDVKLMSLLKAARGAVIEDLIVDWGTEEPETEGNGCFELVSGPPVEGPPAPQSQPSPVNLFNEEIPSDDDMDIGPKKISVQLPPPPIIQQAPVTDKLPIPLYPGFRCSIFAIVKQPSNPGPHSTSIRITGKVLGREVTFETPVSPRAISLSVTSKVTDGGRLLHALAAKALIQLYEDKPSSPETRAHIERLGKRYSLASSMTSFLAIDEESNTVIEHKGEHYHSQELLPTASSGGVGASLPPPQNQATSKARKRKRASFSVDIVDVPISRNTSISQPQRRAHVFIDANADLDFLSSRLSKTPDQEEYQSLQRAADYLQQPSMDLVDRERVSVTRGSRRHRKSSIDSADRRKRSGSGLHSRPRSHRLQQPSTDLVERGVASSFISSHLLGGLEGGGPSYPLSTSPLHLPAPAVSTETPGSSPRESKTKQQASSLTTPVVTLESIVRGQKFNGSFPNDKRFLRGIYGHGAVPEMPDLLRNLDAKRAAMTSVKMEIWATALVVAYLRRSFAAENDTWGMVAEKAMVFIKESLEGIDARYGDLGEALVGDAEKRL